MSDIPDKVIEQAHGAADRAWTDAEPWRGPRAFAGVIAGWARAEERERIKRLVVAESGQARRNYNTDPQAYFRGVEDGMENLLAALDRDGSDTREDGK